MKVIIFTYLYIYITDGDDGSCDSWKLYILVYTLKIKQDACFWISFIIYHKTKISKGKKKYLFTLQENCLRIVHKIMMACNTSVNTGKIRRIAVRETQLLPSEALLTITVLSYWGLWGRSAIGPPWCRAALVSRTADWVFKIKTQFRKKKMLAFILFNARWQARLGKI